MKLAVVKDNGKVYQFCGDDAVRPSLCLIQNLKGQIYYIETKDVEIIDETDKRYNEYKEWRV